MSDCRSCDSYGWECHPGPEDFNEPCPYVKSRVSLDRSEEEPRTESELEETEVLPVSILDLAKFMGAREDEKGHLSGAEFARLGLPIIGGCEGCGATIACYNAYPSKSGYLRCSECIGNLGWDDAAKAKADIFG